MNRATNTAIALALTFAAATASAASPADASLSDRLFQMLKGSVSCQQLTADWRRTDAMGVTVSMEIRQGQATVTRSRIGLPDEVRAGHLPLAQCLGLAATVVASESWAVRVPKAQGADAEWLPRVRVGVSGGRSFATQLPARTDTPELRRLTVVTEQLDAIAHAILTPTRAAGL